MPKRESEESNIASTFPSPIVPWLPPWSQQLLGKQTENETTRFGIVFLFVRKVLGHDVIAGT